MKETLYTQTFEVSDMQISLGVSDKGLVFAAPSSDCEKERATYQWLEDTQVTMPFVQYYQQYFNDQLPTVSFALDLRGTPFQKQVWETLLTIDYGQVVTYKDVAQKMKRPSAVRAVANAIGKNPILIIIPCHRVIGSNGQLTGFGWGIPLKKRLLTLEKNILSTRAKG